MSDFLFARPSFFNGFISVVDIWGIPHSYNSSRSPIAADRRAMYADMQSLQNDMKVAFSVLQDE